MEQFSKFCRTLLPTEPFQAMLLLGVVLISFSRQLGWYSRPLVFKYTQSTNALHRFESFMIFAVLLTVFAGCAGYFVCFWPGKHPARRTIVTVLLPAFDLLVSVGIFFGTHLALSYLYAWAYLKSDSIIPAIMLHAILNLSTLFRIELDFPGARFARPVVWAVGTLLLFRLWPVVRRIAPAVEIADADPSPAT